MVRSVFLFDLKISSQPRVGNLWRITRESKIFLQAQILPVSEFKKWIVDFTPLDDTNLVVRSVFSSEHFIFQPFSRLE